MKLIYNPDKSEWAELLKRPLMDTESLHDSVRGIIEQVKEQGDQAVMSFEETFDHVKLHSLAVSEEEMAVGCKCA